VEGAEHFPVGITALEPDKRGARAPVVVGADKPGKGRLEHVSGNPRLKPLGVATARAVGAKVGSKIERRSPDPAIRITDGKRVWSIRVFSHEHPTGEASVAFFKGKGFGAIQGDDQRIGVDRKSQRQQSFEHRRADINFSRGDPRIVLCKREAAGSNRRKALRDIDRERPLGRADPSAGKAAAGYRDIQLKHPGKLTEGQ